MANVINGNTLYADTASSAVGSYIAEKDVQLVGLSFTSDTVSNSITINDIKQFNESAAPAVGSVKLKIAISAIGQTLFIDLADSPIRFPNGIWISAISSNSSATLIFRTKS